MHSSMNSFNTWLEKTKVFFVTYKWLLFPIVPIIIFIYIIIYLFYAQKNPTEQLTNIQPTSAISQSPQPSQASQQSQISVLPSEEAAVSPGETTSDQALQSSIDQQAGSIATGSLKFAQVDQGDSSYPGDNEVSEGSTNTTTLSDGSTEYEYPSDDPNRPHIQIVSNNIVVFRRNNMSDTGITIADYTDLLSQPEYTSQGSSYYGATAEIYAEPTKGIAIVANPQSAEVYEQYLFPAMSVNAYVTKYGKDISAFTPAP